MHLEAWVGRRGVRSWAVAQYHLLPHSVLLRWGSEHGRPRVNADSLLRVNDV